MKTIGGATARDFTCVPQRRCSLKGRSPGPWQWRVYSFIKQIVLKGLCARNHSVFWGYIHETLCGGICRSLLNWIVIFTHNLEN